MRSEEVVDSYHRIDEQVPGPLGSGQSRLGRAWAIVLTIAFIVSALYVFAMWLIDTRPLMNLNSYERAQFVDMVYGRAYKPFVYRTLLPTLVRWVRQAIPDAVNYDTHGKVYARWPSLYAGMLYLGWELEYLTEYATATVLMFAALLGFGWALKWLARELYAMPEWLAWALPAAGMWVLPPFFVRGTHYSYDFVQLLIFALLLGAMAKRRWSLFYVLFVIGMFNKETTALISLIFVLYMMGRLSRRALVTHVGAQLGGAVAIKALLGVWFAGNPGSVVEDHVLINLYNALLRPYDLAAVVVVIALLALVLKDYACKPRLLLCGLAIAIPMGALYATLGTYGEIRVFYELVPIVFLLVLQTILTWLGVHMETRPEHVLLRPTAGAQRRDVARC